MDLIGGVSVGMAATVGVNASDDEKDEVEQDGASAKNAARQGDAAAGLEVASVDLDVVAVDTLCGALGYVIAVVDARLHGAATAQESADDRAGERAAVAGAGNNEGGRGVDVGSGEEGEEQEPDDKIKGDVGARVHRGARGQAADDVGQVPDEGEAERDEEEEADIPGVASGADADKGEEQADDSHHQLGPVVRLARVAAVERAHCDGMRDEKGGIRSISD